MRQKPYRGAKVGSLAAVLLIGLLALVSVRAQKPAPSVDPNRVVVAWFENRTGDSALDNVGEGAADWISTALAKENVAPVAPAADVRALSTGDLKGPAARSAALAQRTQAGVMVRGHYSKRGEQLAFVADIVDPASDKVLGTVGPVVGTIGGTDGYDALSQRLTAMLDARRMWGDGAFAWPPPENLKAWREYVTGEMEHFNKSDWAGAIPFYERALALDPDFLSAKWGMWVANRNLGRNTEAEKWQAIVQPLMTAHPGALNDSYEWLAASYARDYEKQYQAGQRQLARDPQREGYSVALPAVRTGRFTEVVELYRRRDSSPTTLEWRPWDGITLYSLHTLGRHDEELEVARENVARRGFDWGTAYWELYALSALGRTVEVDALLVRMADLKPENTNTVGVGYHVAGWEYLAHGNEALAGAMFEKGLAYFRSLPAAQQEALAGSIAQAYLDVGDFAEAIRRWDPLSRAAPGNMARLGLPGVAAVLQGDDAKTREMQAKLETANLPAALVWRSIMASQQGDCSGAVRLRREALAKGAVANNYNFHWWNAYGKAKACIELPGVTGQRGERN